MSGCSGMLIKGEKLEEGQTDPLAFPANFRPGNFGCSCPGAFYHCGTVFFYQLLVCGRD